MAHRLQQRPLNRPLHLDGGGGLRVVKRFECLTVQLQQHTVLARNGVAAVARAVQQAHRTQPLAGSEHCNTPTTPAAAGYVLSADLNRAAHDNPGILDLIACGKYHLSTRRSAWPHASEHFVHVLGGESFKKGQHRQKRAPVKINTPGATQFAAHASRYVSGDRLVLRGIALQHPGVERSQFAAQHPYNRMLDLEHGLIALRDQGRVRPPSY